MMGDKVKLVLQTYVPFRNQSIEWREALADLETLQAMVKQIRHDADDCLRYRSMADPQETLHAIIDLIDKE